MPTYAVSPAIDRAWEQYLRDGNGTRLLDVVSEGADAPSVLQLLLWRAMGAGDWSLVKLLEARHVELPQDEQCTPGLLYTCIHEFRDAPHAVEWLIDHGARIDARGPNNWTALHLASSLGCTRVVQLLLEAGADVNALTDCDGGWTPLMEACAAGRKDVVQVLLSHGADSDLRNSLDGGRARDVALSRDHADLVAVLDEWEGRQARRRG